MSKSDTYSGKKNKQETKNIALHFILDKEQQPHRILIVVIRLGTGNHLQD